MLEAGQEYSLDLYSIHSLINWLFLKVLEQLCAEIVCNLVLLVEVAKSLGQDVDGIPSFNSPCEAALLSALPRLNQRYTHSFPASSAVRQ
jgi:hypothetical protein